LVGGGVWARRRERGLRGEEEGSWAARGRLGRQAEREAERVGEVLFFFKPFFKPFQTFKFFSNSFQIFKSF
jgi:hypothetical protein